MRKILFAAVAFVVFASCGDDDKLVKGDTAAAVQASGKFNARYSSQFEMGKSEHAEKVIELWKLYDADKLKDAKAYFADTVTMKFPGYTIRGSRDTVVYITQNNRNGFSEVTSTLDAIMPVRSTDKNEDWVCIWGTEKRTTKGGIVDSTSVHELWRFNKDGKVDYMSQFGQTFPSH